MGTDRPIEMPLEVTGKVGIFDRFATAASNVASRAVFFVLCVALVVLWAPSILLLRDVDTWQLFINTATTIVTFLMVALLQNTQTRSDKAIQHKLNAIADGLADLMAKTARRDDADGLETDMKELRAAVGLERRESTADGERSSSTQARSSAPPA